MGRQYLPVVPVLEIFLIVPALLTITEIGVAAIYAFERQGFLAVALTPTCLLNVLLAWTLVPRHGAIGAAIASIIAQSLETALVVWYAARISNAGAIAASAVRVWLCAAVSADSSGCRCVLWRKYAVRCGPVIVRECDLCMVGGEVGGIGKF